MRFKNIFKKFNNILIQIKIIIFKSIFPIILFLVYEFFRFLRFEIESFIYL